MIFEKSKSGDKTEVDKIECSENSKNYDVDGDSRLCAIREAAILVLEKQEGLTAFQIYEKMVEEKLYMPRGRKSRFTVQSAIKRACINSAISNKSLHSFKSELNANGDEIFFIWKPEAIEENEEEIIDENEFWSHSIEKEFVKWMGFRKYSHKFIMRYRSSIDRSYTIFKKLADESKIASANSFEALCIYLSSLYNNEEFKDMDKKECCIYTYSFSALAFFHEERNGLGIGLTGFMAEPANTHIEIWNDSIKHCFIEWMEKNYSAGTIRAYTKSIQSIIDEYSSLVSKAESESRTPLEAVIQLECLLHDDVKFCEEDSACGYKYTTAMSALIHFNTPLFKIDYNAGNAKHDNFSTENKSVDFAFWNESLKGKFDQWMKKGDDSKKARGYTDKMSRLLRDFSDLADEASEMSKTKLEALGKFIILLEKNKKFNNINQTYSYEFSKVLNELKRCFESEEEIEKSAAKKHKQAIEVRIAEVLKKEFPMGLPLADYSEVKRAYENEYHEKLDLNDDELKVAIEKNTIAVSRRMHADYLVSAEILTEIEKHLEYEFSKGAERIYIKDLFRLIKSSLQSFMDEELLMQVVNSKFGYKYKVIQGCDFITLFKKRTRLKRKRERGIIG
jgi:hypothetical protein